jgi:hypothetical protein
VVIVGRYEGDLTTLHQLNFKHGIVDNYWSGQGISFEIWDSNGNEYEIIFASFVMPCSLVESCHSFVGTCSWLAFHGVLFYPENGNKIFFWKVDNFLSGYRFHIAEYINS